jgi:hypothetical protein
MNSTVSAITSTGVITSTGAVTPVITGSSQQFVTKDFTIKGEMITSTRRFSEHDMLNLNKDAVRQELALDLAHQLLSNKLIQFTQAKDPMGDIVVNARAFVVPSNQVQLIRDMRG